MMISISNASYFQAVTLCIFLCRSSLCKDPVSVQDVEPSILNPTRGLACFIYEPLVLGLLYKYQIATF